MDRRDAARARVELSPSAARAGAALLWALPALHALAWGLYAALRRPFGDYGVETDFFGDYVPWSREWMAGHPSVMNGFKGPVYYVVLGFSSRAAALFTGAAVGPPPPGLEFAVGKALSVTSAALTLFLVGRCALRLHGARAAAVTAQVVVASALPFVAATFRAATDPVALLLATAALERAIHARLPRTAVLAGALAALAALTRAHWAAQAPVAIGAVLLTSRSPRLASAAAAGFVVVSLPWWSFVASVMGDPFWTRNVQNAAFELFAPTGAPVDAFLGARLPFDSWSDLWRADPARVAAHWSRNLARHVGFDLRTLLGVPSTLLVAAGLLALVRRGDLRTLALLALAFACTALSLVPAFYDERFALPLLPVYALTAGASIAWVANRRFAPRAGAALLALLLAVSWARAVRIAEDPDSGYQPREIAAVAREMGARGLALEPGARIAARKPHAPYWLGHTATALPTASSLPRLVQALREDRTRYLYVGTSEMHLRPYLRPLADPRETRDPPGLRRLVAGFLQDDDRILPGVLYEVEGLDATPRGAAGQWDDAHLTPAQRPAATPRGWPRTAWVRHRLGEYLLSTGEAGAAAPYAISAAESMPLEWRAQARAGDALLLSGAGRPALQYFERARDLAPDSVSVLARLVSAHAALSDRTAADDALRSALTRARSRSPAELGAALASRGEFAAAFGPLTHAAEMDSADWRSRQWLGILAWDVRGDAAEADRWFREAAPHAPADDPEGARVREWIERAP